MVITILIASLLIMGIQWYVILALLNRLLKRNGVEPIALSTTVNSPAPEPPARVPRFSAHVVG